jgi:hypothetical protein
VALILIEAIFFRIYLRWKSAQLDRRPAFHDGWAFGGIAVIICMWLINWRFGLTLQLRGLMFCGLTIAVAVLEKRRFVELLALIQKSM